MKVEKSAVAAALRRQGDYDRAQQAECTLPRRVDTERDANLLQQLDVDLCALKTAQLRIDRHEPV